MKQGTRDIAPEFSAKDQDGNDVSLSSYKGKWILLYFYPEDDTPGCTKEACGLRDNFSELSKHVTILGVSADTVESHKKFIEKYHLPFTLVADPEKKIIHMYGSDEMIFAKRVSFLINPEGKIAKIYDKVKPDTHAREILRDIEVLAK